MPVGPKSIIENDKNGVLVPYEDVEKMTEEAVGILKNDSYKRRLADTSKKMSYRYLPDEVMPLWFDIFDGKAKG